MKTSFPGSLFFLPSSLLLTPGGGRRGREIITVIHEVILIH